MGKEGHIRHADAQDIDSIVEAEMDKENNRFIRAWTKEQHVQALKNENMLYLVVEDEGKFIGYVILAGLKAGNDSIELMRITIMNKEKGYGRAVFQTIKELAFKELKANRLWLDVKEHA